MTSSVPPQRSTRRTSARRPDDVGDVLEHLAGPDDVDRVLVERERRALLDAARVEPGHARPRPPQRLLGDVDGDHVASGGAQLRGERAVAGAQVEHAIARAHVREQERAARGEPLRRRAGRHRPPHRLAPRLHAAARCHIPALTTLPDA